MRPCTASSCCCQVQSVSWAPVPTPHAAARPSNLSWAPVPPPHAAARSQSVSWVPVRPSHCCCQARPNLSWAPVPPPHAAAQVSRVCHGSLYGLPLLLSLSPHCGSTLWWFWPRATAQMSEVCGDSKIDGNSSACHTD
ncbi:unnamed protein product [Staurois parvus]|uniref:Uncharacterized protein n=1 Tax=Staurois parvus TaxID=386267 RepID=A0ABN9CAP7_9NEOB|nr:unnamed protein product [Staurois parvus]